MPERPRLISSSPLPLYLEDTNVSDQPESDQHVTFPIVCQEGLIESEALFENPNVSEEHLANLEDNLSHESLESEDFFSDLVFSESPSPVAFDHRERDRPSSLVEDWRSCPELDKERDGSFSDLSQIEFMEFSFTENMEKSISKSAHTLKVKIDHFKLVGSILILLPLYFCLKQRGRVTISMDVTQLEL